MKEEAGEVVVGVAAEEEDYFRVRVMALVLGRVEAKDTVREKAMECSVEAAVEEVVVEVGLGLGLVPDLDRGVAQGLEEEAEAEVAGVEEEGEAEAPEVEMDQATARDTVAEANLEVGAVKEVEAEAEAEEEEAGAEAEVPLGVAPGLVQDTGQAMAPDVEDGKRFRRENKSSIEISVSLGHIL